MNKSWSINQIIPVNWSIDLTLTQCSKQQETSKQKSSNWQQKKLNGKPSVAWELSAETTLTQFWQLHQQMEGNDGTKTTPDLEDTNGARWEINEEKTRVHGSTRQRPLTLEDWFLWKRRSSRFPLGVLSTMRMASESLDSGSGGICFTSSSFCRSRSWNQGIDRFVSQPNQPTAPSSVN